jgi:endonuclease YncB( thermonuclease family)
VVIVSWQDRNDKYGRILGRILIDAVDVNQRMVDEGQAAIWYGTGPKPVA